MTNVLIVDDEKIEREGLKYLLSREEGKRTVFEAANGKQALQVLRSEDIQLLLTDIKMPHMTGLELSKKAKEENPNLQIIIFSGFSVTFAQEAIRYGVTEYILKPVNPDDFHKVLERAESEISKRRKKESCRLSCSGSYRLSDRHCPHLYGCREPGKYGKEAWSIH